MGDFLDVPTTVRLAATDNKDENTNWHAEVLAFLDALKASGHLADWNQVAFLFRSVKNDKVVALARFLEDQGVPVFSPCLNMFFEREEIRRCRRAIFLFPQFPKVRSWAEGVSLPIGDYYDHQCFKPFADELRKPENKPLLDWARPLAKHHALLTQNTDYAFSGLFYQLLQFPLFSRFLTEDAVQGVDKGRAARNLGTFSKLITKFEYLHFVSVLNPEWLEKNIRDLFNQFLRFLQDGGIGEYEDESEYAPKGCVSFLTIHQSKGLEVSGRHLRIAGGSAAQAVWRTGCVARGWRLPLEETIRTTRPHQELRFLAAFLHSVLTRSESACAGGAGETRARQVTIQVF